MTATDSGQNSRPWYKKKILWFILAILAVLSTGAAIIYGNFNRLLSEALMKSFDSSIISDVYELKFENLRVDLLAGDIRVSNVIMQPREHPLRDYPYINSSFRLTTDKLVLKKVNLRDLLKKQILELDKIEIDRPEVKLELAGEIHVLFPFNDSTAVTGKNGKKKPIESFHLKKFELIDANFQATNSFEQRKFNVVNLNFTLSDIYISQHFGLDSMGCKSAALSIESMEGTLLKSPLRQIGFSDFKFNIENLEVQKTLDTVVFHFNDFSTALNSLALNTADSIFTVTVQNFGLSYKEKSIKLHDVEFKPNISEAAMQKRFQFQNTQVSGRTGLVELVNLNFDSLIYRQQLFIDEILIDNVSVKIFKDKTKPVDPEKFPGYPGQQVAGIGLPLLIKKVTVNGATIVNRERKPDGSYAKVTVGRMKATVENVTNLASDKPLALKGEAYLENKVRFKIALDFDYVKPQFSIDGSIGKFNLMDLNPLLKTYTPAIIKSGMIDEISFSGIAYRSNASGTMKFLYHDLNIDLQLKEQARWKSSLGAFAANTYLHASNPAAADEPPRIVKYEVERDMHKAFINMVLKSLFAGVKETMILSKENRKAFHETKKEWKQKK